MARLNTIDSVPASVERRRWDLRAGGVLEQEGDKLVLQKITSPTLQARQQVSCWVRQKNGWYGWEDADSRHFDELERQ